MADDKAGEPTHIIVFRETSPKNGDVMKKLLNVNHDKSASVRTSATMFTATRGSKVRPILYERLGVAVAELRSDDLLERLKGDSHIQAVVPNAVRRLPPVIDHGADGARHPTAARRDDPMAAYLQGLRDAADMALQFRTGGKRLDEVSSGASHSWCLDLLRIGPDYASATGRGVKVAILDTGLDYGHPDFGDLRRGVGDASFVPGEEVTDGHGHGTHCAGVIRGPRASRGGIRYGVAPETDLIVAKVLNNSGEGRDSWILDAIDWAADSGARIISMSLGSKRSIGQAYNPIYERVASSLLSGDPGVLLIAAAGNDSNRPAMTSPVHDPAACPSVYAVAALDADRRIAPFSCRQMDNAELNASGPGVAVHSAWLRGGFRVLSGTSMATPHVGGVAALYLEREPRMKASALWERLTSTALVVGDKADFGAGLVQAPAA